MLNSSSKIINSKSFTIRFLCKKFRNTNSNPVHRSFSYIAYRQIHFPDVSFFVRCHILKINSAIVISYLNMSSEILRYISRNRFLFIFSFKYEMFQMMKKIKAIRAGMFYVSDLYFSIQRRQDRIKRNGKYFSKHEE